MKVVTNMVFLTDIRKTKFEPKEILSCDYNNVFVTLIEKTRFKPKQMIKNVNTPLNMEIFDQCSQTMGSQSARQELCNVELSKFKIVQVLFGQLTEVAFGSYYVVNAEGRSAEVLIKEMVDGSYSEWTEWGPWDTVRH